MNIAILIPAYNPSEELASFVERLASAKVRAVIVVNDGSDPGCGPTFLSCKGQGAPCSLNMPSISVRGRR